MKDVHSACLSPESALRQMGAAFPRTAAQVARFLPMVCQEEHAVSAYGPNGEAVHGGLRLAIFGPQLVWAEFPYNHQTVGGFLARVGDEQEFVVCFPTGWLQDSLQLESRVRGGGELRALSCGRDHLLLRFDVREWRRIEQILGRWIK